MKKALGITAVLVAALALAGCTPADLLGDEAETPKTTERAPVTKVDDPDVFETTAKLSDGREVTCLKYAGHQRGGLSCDWAHAGPVAGTGSVSK